MRARFWALVERRKTDEIDYSVGIYLNKKSGECVKKGEVLYTIYSNDEAKTQQAKEICKNAFEFSATPPALDCLIYKIIK